MIAHLPKKTADGRLRNLDVARSMRGCRVESLVVTTYNHFSFDPDDLHHFTEVIDILRDELSSVTRLHLSLNHEKDQNPLLLALETVISACTGVTDLDLVTSPNPYHYRSTLEHLVQVSPKVTRLSVVCDAIAGVDHHRAMSSRFTASCLMPGLPLITSVKDLIADVDDLIRWKVAGVVTDVQVEHVKVCGTGVGLAAGLWLVDGWIRDGWLKAHDVRISVKTVEKLMISCTDAAECTITEIGLATVAMGTRSLGRVILDTDALRIDDGVIDRLNAVMASAGRDVSVYNA